MNSKTAILDPEISLVSVSKTIYVKEMTDGKQAKFADFWTDGLVIIMKWC